MNNKLKLIIGNKNYSSWSLRPWLLLSAHDIPFEEVVVPLFTKQSAAQLAEYSAAGKVPVLHDGNLIIWDSLAILEYVSEQYLNGQGWPEAAEARATARSCCAEMHAGFFAIRHQLPVNCRATHRVVDMTADIKKEVARLDAMWSDLRTQYADQGPWLFGKFSIADCMFAPLAIRFNTYGVTVSEPSTNYLNHVLKHPKVMQWMADAEKESETISQFEVGL